MRPIIGIPGRVASEGDARRVRVRGTQQILESIYAAGGEPVILYPRHELAGRFDFIDGLLIPGGGDVDPTLYGDTDIHPEVYDVDHDQDLFDMAALRYALDHGIPTLAICRGFQVANVALGGTLEQHMDQHHRDMTHTIAVSGLVADITGPEVTASCYHHQRVKKLAPPFRVLATDTDGTIEAVDIPDAKGWFLGLQWHPEHTAAGDPAQQSVFDAFLKEAVSAKR